MRGIQQVNDIMVRKVTTARNTTTLTNIAKLMNRNRIGSVIIVDRAKPTGILTESDIIRLVARGINMKNAVAEDFMHRHVVACDPSVSVVDALMIMHSERIRHLPVVKKQKLVGVISIRDLIAATQLSSFYVI